MPWTTKLLVIANRTVDSDELCEVLTQRAAAGPLQVTLVAPASGIEGSAKERHRATAQRLQSALERLREAGVAADGVVGDSDPMAAVQDTWDPRSFDEVIVATLPTAASRWLAANLPRRVERFTGAQVTHVVAAAQRSPARSA